MKPKDEIKFYCDNCGAQVPYNAEICPNCRGSFRSVMCPKCEFTAESKHFSRGCPNCGHMAPKLALKGFGSAHKKGLSYFLSNKFYLLMIPVLILLFVLLSFLYMEI